MFGVGKKVSFSVVIAMVVGLGIFSILVLQTSATLLQAQTDELDQQVPLPPGVKLSLQVDKKIYKAGDTVLLAMRNDSRLTIWIAAHADGCQGSWWQVQELGNDGTTWSPVTLSKDTCQTKNNGLVKFDRHTLQTDQWQSVVPSSQLGNIVQPAPVGTYRIVAPYLKGTTVKESDWGGILAHQAQSPTFTIQ